MINQKQRLVIAIVVGVLAQVAFWIFSMPGPQLRGAVGFAAATFACLISWGTLMLIPGWIALGVLKLTPQQLGLGLGDAKFGWKAVFWVTPGFVIATLVGSGDIQLQEFYPIPGDEIGLTTFGILSWFLVYLVFYISFEFFYRGFLISAFLSKDFPPQDSGWALSKTMWVLIGMQTVCCFLVHIGKPEAEMWASIPASILFGWIACRAHSIWYPLIIHFIVGMANDLAALWQADSLLP